MTSSTDAALDALYADLPTIACEGHCWDTCGAIQMSAAEHDRIARAGVDIPNRSFSETGPTTCPALTMFRQCGVYDIRPLICRIWGLSRKLRCPYGCKPSRQLTNRETFELLSRAAEISGDHETVAKFRQLLTDPDFDAKQRAADRTVQARHDDILYQINGNITR